MWAGFPRFSWMVARETWLGMGPTPAGETMRRLRELVEDIKCHHHLPCSIFQGPNQFTKIGLIVLSNNLLSGFSSAMLNQILSLSLSLSLEAWNGSSLPWSFQRKSKHRRKDPPIEYWTGSKSERLLLRLSTPTQKGVHGLFSFIFINNNVKDNHSLQINSLTIWPAWSSLS